MHPISATTQQAMILNLSSLNLDKEKKREKETSHGDDNRRREFNKGSTRDSREKILTSQESKKIEYEWRQKEIIENAKFNGQKNGEKAEEEEGDCR